MAERLAGALAGCTALVTCALSYNQVGDKGAEGFARLLRECSSLASLDLSANRIGARGAGMLASAPTGRRAQSLVCCS